MWGCDVGFNNPKTNGIWPQQLSTRGAGALPNLDTCPAPPALMGKLCAPSWGRTGNLGLEPPLWVSLLYKRGFLNSPWQSNPSISWRFCDWGRVKMSNSSLCSSLWQSVTSGIKERGNMWEEIFWSEMLNSEYLIAFIRNHCCHRTREELKLPRFFLKLLLFVSNFISPLLAVCVCDCVCDCVCAS